MKLQLTGYDLSLEQLLDIREGRITYCSITLPRGGTRQISLLSGTPSSATEEFFPWSVTAMTATLLANMAVSVESDLAETLLQLLCMGELRPPHANCSDEFLALTELLGDESFVDLLPSCLSVALAAELLFRGKLLVQNADICTAMHLEAIRGELAAFDDRLHSQGRPFAGQIATAANIRTLTKGSQYTTEQGRLAFGFDTAPRCQDAICIRAVPQTHGGVRDSLAFLEQVLGEQLNNVRSGPNPILSHAVEHATIALIDLGNISERRDFRLLDSHLSYGLNDNLVYDNPGFNHGLPVVQEAATALLGELKLAALPAAATDDVSSLLEQGSQYRSARKAIVMLPFLEKIIAVEAFMSFQAMVLVQKALPDYRFGDGTAAVYATFCSQMEAVYQNRYLNIDLHTALRMVTDGDLIQSAQLAVGRLR